MIVDEPVPCPSAIGGLAEAFAQAICEKRVECCSDSMGSCLDEVEQAFDEIYPDLQTAEEAETVAMNCTAFDTCSAAIHSASCDDWPAQVGTMGQLPVDEPACWDIVEARLQENDSCDYHYECADGWCNPTGNVCVDFAEENEDCSAAFCDQRYFCNASDLCQKKLENGLSCSNDDQCKSGVCDTEDTAECIPPGEAMCMYVPQGISNCSLVGAPTGGRGHNLPWLVALAGLGMAAAGRRRRAKH